MLKNKIEYLLKHNVLVLTIYKKFFSAFFQIMGKFLKVNKNLILFSANSQKYVDSPRSIYEYMINSEKYKNYEFVWALKDIDIEIPGKAKKIKIDTIKYFITALKAKYWITSVNIERGLNFKKKETKFMNTWHGIAINKMGNAVKNRNDFDWTNVDFIPYSNKAEIDIYIKDFNANISSMLPYGLPRNDTLYNVSDKEIEEIKNRLGINKNKKIILYAPTWRDSRDFGKNYFLIPPIDWKSLKNKFSKDYIILLRTHPYTTRLLNVEFDEFLLDMTLYPNINDLLKISDILISDYSSTILDYSILERPILCFGYDYDEYSLIRGFYYDLEKELPSGVIRTQQELEEYIINIDFNLEKEKTIKFKNKHVVYGGNATEKCVRKMFD